jgi:hypothetical protein
MLLDLCLLKVLLECLLVEPPLGLMLARGLISLVVVLTRVMVRLASCLPFLVKLAM